MSVTVAFAPGTWQANVPDRQLRGPHVHLLALRAEDPDDLRRTVDDADPVRRAGVEVHRLARLQEVLLLAEDEPHPAAEDVDPVAPLVLAQDRLATVGGQADLERMRRRALRVAV